MHDFHSDEYVERWAGRVGNPLRDSVMRHLLAHLSLLARGDFHIVELAPGPGFLAHMLLSGFPAATYEGADFSDPMRRRATDRLSEYSDRARLHHADLRSPDWPAVISRPADVVLSMQALHDVGGEDAHDRVYGAARRVLTPGGLALNADFMRRGGSGPGIELDTHLSLLRGHGYEEVRCTLDIGRYACVVATAPAG